MAAQRAGLSDAGDQGFRRFESAHFAGEPASASFARVMRQRVPVMKLFVHLGAHKTASTHLQHALRRSRSRLTENGVAYFGPTALRSRAIGLPVVAKGENSRADQRFTLAVRPHLARSERVILSDENLLGPLLPYRHKPAEHLYPLAAERLGRVLALAGRSDVTVLIAVRDPGPFLVSSYCQRLLSGRILSFEEFLAGRDLRLVKWSELVLRLLAVPLVSRCVVWRYEDYPEVAPQVLGRMLPADLARAIELPEGVVNPGLSAQAHAHVMRTHSADPQSDGRALVAEARKRFAKSDSSPGYAPLSPKQSYESRAAYGADLDWLSEQAGIDFLAPPLSRKRGNEG